MGDPPLQVVDKDGVFNKNGLEGFVEECGLNKAGSKYQVVSIMGPQSSGKSTLLNHLVGSRPFASVLPFPFAFLWPGA